MIACHPLNPNKNSTNSLCSDVALECMDHVHLWVVLDVKCEGEGIFKEKNGILVCCAGYGWGEVSSAKASLNFSLFVVSLR